MVIDKTKTAVIFIKRSYCEHSLEIKRNHSITIEQGIFILFQWKTEQSTYMKNDGIHFIVARNIREC